METLEQVKAYLLDPDEIPRSGGKGILIGNSGGSPAPPHSPWEVLRPIGMILAIATGIIGAITSALGMW